MKELPDTEKWTRRPDVGKAIVDAYMSHGTCYGLREVVVGSDPFDYEQIWNDMWAKTYYYGRSGPVMHVMSGIDMAIWDIMGKATGKPVHKLLGGSYTDKVRAYASALMPENKGDGKKNGGDLYFAGIYGHQIRMGTTWDMMCSSILN